MNWDAMGAIAELVGAVAVIGTLFYLARQISHSVVLARASQNKGLMDSYADLNDMIITTPDLKEILVRMKEVDPDFSPTEMVTVKHFAFRMCNNYNSAQSAFNRGQISESEFDFYQDDLIEWIRLYPALSIQLTAVLNDYPRAQEWQIYSPLKPFSGEKR